MRPSLRVFSLLCLTALVGSLVVAAPASPAPTDALTSLGLTTHADSVHTPTGVSTSLFCTQTLGGLGTGDLLPAPGACATPVDPVCVNATDPTQRIELVYAVPSGTADRFASMAPTLRGLARQANGVVHAEAARENATIDLRLACDAGVIRVADVAVPDVTSAAAGSALGGIATSLASQGYNSSYAKYWIWYDGARSDDVAGVSTLAHDDRLAPDNANNRTTGYAVVFGSTNYVTMLHELSHAMGAVQPSAPHSTPGGHCLDGQDVMCYDERLTSGGGAFQTDDPTRTTYDPAACPDREWYDCHHDDYFDPAPAAGSYLATHWNLASPLNGFVQVG